MSVSITVELLYGGKLCLASVQTGVLLEIDEPTGAGLVLTPTEVELVMTLMTVCREQVQEPGR